MLHNGKIHIKDREKERERERSRAIQLTVNIFLAGLEVLRLELRYSSAVKVSWDVDCNSTCNCGGRREGCLGSVERLSWSTDGGGADPSNWLLAFMCPSSGARGLGHEGQKLVKEVLLGFVVHVDATRTDAFEVRSIDTSFQTKLRLNATCTEW